MKKVVISLGGSLIIPKEINHKFLQNFRKILRKNYKNYKFIVVCGGGAIARKYISALREIGASEFEQAQAGIRATRMNAKFMMQYFGKEANDDLPLNIVSVKSNLPKNNVVFCGALRWTPNSTSDGTAAKLANSLKCQFINLTNVNGLYTEDPKKSKKAKLISEISYLEFKKFISKKIKKHEPGQHFVLDKKAAMLSCKHKIPTYILGSIKDLDNLLNNKKYVGTKIS